MTLDERIRTTLERAASAVPYTSATHPDEIRRRGQRRRSRRYAIRGLGLLALVLGVLVIALPFDPNAIDPAATHPVETVEIADLAITVVDSEPALTDPDVWLGLRGPTPRFDTSALGEDLSFGAGEPQVGDLDERNQGNDGWPRVERAVYLGELEEEPFYVFSGGAPSIWDRIFEVIEGNFSGDVLGTSLGCCTGGDMDHQNWLPGISILSSTGEPDLIVVEWLGLSPDVSVVAYQLDGDYIGWQTPVGGISSLQLDRRPEEYVGISFDAAGRELGRFGPYEMGRAPDVSASLTETTDTLTAEELWAPLTSEGSEIQADEIPAELQDPISPRAGDRLFLVPVDGDEIIVLVRDNTPHVFAVSCEVLDRVVLPPNWEGTCID